ncbi:MAG: hypothetical protein AYK23_00160 [Candidatus Proteinoplasmatales archaeon SG8-5]|nr:MAG: hypothetical protein AYK23_00160 [Candidatus Proteinoplasmatales archaeon SG8-5]
MYAPAKVVQMRDSSNAEVMRDAYGGRLRKETRALYGSLQDKGVTPVDDWRTTHASNTPSARVRVRR